MEKLRRKQEETKLNLSKGYVLYYSILSGITAIQCDRNTTTLIHLLYRQDTLPLYKSLEELIVAQG